MYQDSSHMYRTQWEEPHMGISNNLVKVVGSEQIMSFDPFKSPPCNILMSQIQTQQPHHHQNIIEVVPAANWSFEFPKTITTESNSVMLCQASASDGDNFTNSSHAQFTFSLPSVAESLLSSSIESPSSSSEKYSEFPSYSSQKHSDVHEPCIMAFCEQFPQEHDSKLARDDAATDHKPLEISFQRNHQLVSFTKAEKQCVQPCGVKTSSRNSASRRAAISGKRRIRWTKDLHESFMNIVNRLGGPDKAKPKAILEMMKSNNLLSISHVKSHLQKCRSTIFQHKALHERSEEGHKSDGVTELQVKIHMQIEESRQLQLEVKRSIHKQLEMQRNLQVLIEQQREHLKVLYDQQKERTKLEKNP